MLILLPPSEGKAAGGTGPALDLAALSFPALTPIRARLVEHLQALAVTEPDALRLALKLSGKQVHEVANNAALSSSPTLPALARYTGIVYDNLGYDTLTGPARRRANASLVVASALFGLLRPTDQVPAYLLSGGTVLPGLGGLSGGTVLPAPSGLPGFGGPPSRGGLPSAGGLAPLWRSALETELAAAPGLVVDLRSGVYAGLANVPGAVEVRVLRDTSGVRSVVRHDNKWTKGRLARALCEHGARNLAEVAEVGRTVSDAVELSDGKNGPRVDLLLSGLASNRDSLASARAPVA